MKVHVPHLKLGHKARRLVYVGNGATSVDSEYNKTESAECDRRFVSSTWSGFSYPKLQNPFVRDDADCIGFYARRRTPVVWEWYCTDGSWHRTEADMPEKMLFPVGSSVKELYKDEDSIYFVTQWEDKHGIRVNCGSDIFSKPLMGHAFGGMDDKTYHNTMAALEHGIETGYKDFELDFSYTTDGRLVLSHGWSPSNCKCLGITYKPDFDNMTYERVMNMPIHGNPIMDARQFYERVKDEPDYRFEVDFHFVQEHRKEMVQELVKDFENDGQVLDRLLMQVYTQQMYQIIDGVYHFKNYSYLAGKYVYRLDEFLTFCLDKGICAIALRANLAKREYIDKIHNAGLYVMTYTVQRDADYAKHLLDSGIDTICTDFITEELLDEAEGFGYFPFYVWYNSDRADVENHYSEDARDQFIQTKKGNLEYKDKTVWENDGSGTLRKCEFSVQGKRFVGWKLRVTLDGNTFWYCKDGLYHIKKDFDETKDVVPYIFADEAVIPVWKVKRNMKLVMVAVWEDLG